MGGSCWQFISSAFIAVGTILSDGAIVTSVTTTVLATGAIAFLSVLCLVGLSGDTDYHQRCLKYFENCIQAGEIGRAHV